MNRAHALRSPQNNAQMAIVHSISWLRGAIGLLAIVWSGVVPAAADPCCPSSDLSASDWSSIRASYEANRHRACAVEGGWQARNPGQQWTTRFDGRGFLTAPDGGGWSWGLELVGYGRGDGQRAVTTPTCIDARGVRVEYEWDEALTEWYINDRGGLEHGYTVHRRPDDAEVESTSLKFMLAVSGNLRLRVNGDQRGVTFFTDAGAAVVNYAGLRVFDADGVDVPAWFETAGDGLQLTVDDSGARYPLTIDPIAQQAYVKASNTDPFDNFGHSVAVSGDTVVVGAPQEASSATGVNGNQADNSAGSSGAAYVFVRSGTTWSQQAYLKASNYGGRFGESVAISDDTIVVGAIFEASSATGVNGNQSDTSAPDSGAAYVFVRSGGVWSQQAYLKASNTDAGDFFGLSVAVSGDTVVVGADRENSSATGVNGNGADNSVGLAGAAYVFARTGAVWSQQAYLKASNTGTGDRFGISVTASGDTVVVGALSEDSSATGVNGDQANNGALGSGAVYVFTRSGTTWSQQAYIKASNTNSSDQFGITLAASGDTLVVGANQEDSIATGVNGDQFNNDASNAGAAYVFVRDGGGVWSQQAYLKASNTESSDKFGTCVAISGDRMVIAAIGEDSSFSGVDGNQDDNAISESGAAYVFVRSGATWSQLAYLKASNPDPLDRFGSSVAVSGRTVVVATPLEDSSATGIDGNQLDEFGQDAGAAYVFVDPLPDSDGDGVEDVTDNCPVIANAGQEDSDGDGAGDVCDVCPGTAAGVAADSTGRPHRDCNNDCLFDAADIQCIVDEMLNQ